MRILIQILPLWIALILSNTWIYLHEKLFMRSSALAYVKLSPKESWTQLYVPLIFTPCDPSLNRCQRQQAVPSLKQVQILELVNKPTAALSNSSDSQERSKNVGLRLLALATCCRVSVRR